MVHTPALRNEQAAHAGTTRPVLWWLVAIAVLLFAMVIVGGATRLTDSGLSITQWQPIIGAVPPLSQADWREAFALYKEIPEYQQINRGMSLEEFKAIYWWEWAHRFLGRVIGIAFFVPLAIFWVSGRLERALAGKLAVLFVLGGLQGALGWYMVQSGLVDRVDVSQYRLAAHLALAVAIFAGVVWFILDLARGPAAPWRAGAAAPAGRGATVGALALTGLVFVQIVAGAFAAGLDAGQGYNSWPLMNGQLIPDGLFAATPWYRNLFENAMTVQFDHRLLAYVLIAAAALHLAQCVRRFGEGPQVISAALLLVFVLLQAGLGVWVLLARVPVDLGLAHQGGALVVLTTALWHVHGLMRVPSRG